VKVLILAGNLPLSEHTVRAANKVLHSLVMELMTRGHQVALQLILGGEDRREWSETEQAAIQDLERRGVDVLPGLFRSDYQLPPASKAQRRAAQAYRRLFDPIRYFYPEMRLAPLIAERVRRAGADAMLIFWNREGLAATFGVSSVPKLAYYGMPDHAATAARFHDAELFDLRYSRLSRFSVARDLAAWERAHLRLMRDVDVAANLSADHAEYYTQHGHPRSVYIPNMWPLSPVPAAAAPRAAGDRLKIVGSLGRPGATGNTYGLKFLGEELVPRLDAALGAGKYELHIFGQGEPVPAVRDVLRSPSIHMRGWVPDIDEEIQSAHVFLVANNAGPYRGSHTRFLHAWSLRACCVGHAYNATANPEMIHRQNVLLGETADEIAQLVVEAGSDEALRRRIGEGGWQTYQTHFTAEAVVGRMLQELAPLVNTNTERVH
jgi:glycosyltransferase involved in cell wall biosynthesis